MSHCPTCHSSGILYCMVRKKMVPCKDCDRNALGVANALRKARGETPCGECEGRGWNEVDTSDGRSDSNLYTEPCESCDGTGVEP